MIATQISLLLTILLTPGSLVEARRRPKNNKYRSRSTDYRQPIINTDYDFNESECALEYETLPEEALNAVISNEKTTHIRGATNGFNEQAYKLEVPGFHDYEDRFEDSRRFRRHRGHRRHQRKGEARARHAVSPYISYTLGNLERATPEPGEAATAERIASAQFFYRVSRDIELDGILSFCELETFYVRRFNKFPFFVKSVACRPNKLIMLNINKIMCDPRYEWGHIMRLENREACQEQKGKEYKWIHEWERRVVGCDAMWIR